MKKIKISLLTLAMLAIAISCDDTKTDSQDDTPVKTVVENANDTEVEVENKTIAKDVDANQFKELLASGNGQLIDVRTPGEVAGGMIEGATNIDFNGADFEGATSELDKNTPVYLYCRSGGRSGAAMQVLKANGFKEVYNLLGGYSNWPFK